MIQNFLKDCFLTEILFFKTLGKASILENQSHEKLSINNLFETR